jgi:hypothetical protein
MLAKFLTSLLAPPPLLIPLERLSQEAEQLLASWRDPATPTISKNTQHKHTMVRASGRDDLPEGEHGFKRMGANFQQISTLERTPTPDGGQRLTLREELIPERGESFFLNALALTLQVQDGQLKLSNCQLGGCNFQPTLKDVHRLFDVLDFFRIRQMQGQEFQPAKELLVYFSDHQGLLTQAQARTEHLLSVTLPARQPAPSTHKPA